MKALRGALTLLLLVGIAIWAFQLPGSLDYWWFILGWACAYNLAGALDRLNTGSFIAGTPISPIAEAEEGQVALSGTTRALPGAVERSPLFGIPCVYWRYRIEVLHWGARGSRFWVKHDAGASGGLFLLEDESGRCHVNPVGAEISGLVMTRRRGGAAVLPPGVAPDKRAAWSLLGSYRCVELVLPVNEPLYALGWLGNMPVQLAQGETEEVEALLAEWLRDEAAFLRRFDHNHYGRTDGLVGMAARKAAVEEVRQRRVTAAGAMRNTILARPSDGKPYVLTGRSRGGLRLWLNLQAMAALVLAALSGFALLWILNNPDYPQQLHELLKRMF